jgi:hypothetical protein
VAGVLWRAGRPEEAADVLKKGERRITSSGWARAGTLFGKAYANGTPEAVRPFDLVKARKIAAAGQYVPFLSYLANGLGEAGDHETGFQLHSRRPLRRPTPAGELRPIRPLPDRRTRREDPPREGSGPGGPLRHWLDSRPSCRERGPVPGIAPLAADRAGDQPRRPSAECLRAGHPESLVESRQVARGVRGGGDVLGVFGGREGLMPRLGPAVEPLARGVRPCIYSHRGVRMGPGEGRGQPQAPGSALSRLARPRLTRGAGTRNSLEA